MGRANLPSAASRWSDPKTLYTRVLIEFAPGVVLHSSRTRFLQYLLVARSNVVTAPPPPLRPSAPPSPILPTIALAREAGSGDFGGCT